MLRLGRGLTVGMMHALRLRDALRDVGNDPAVLVEDFDRRTEAEIAPWYYAQIARGRARFAEMEALLDGRDLQPVTDELSRGDGK